jgi:hypothetical protein
MSWGFCSNEGEAHVPKYHAMKAYEGGDDKVPCFLNLSATWETAIRSMT